LRCFLQADAGVLQLQNQQLVQETEIQKQALHEVEDKTRELKERQNAYDDILITFNKHWDQVILYCHVPVSVTSALYSVYHFLFQK
jgi:predicted phosphoribosyltransferase